MPAKQLVRQLLHSVTTPNNTFAFQSWCRETVLKHEKVFQYFFQVFSFLNVYQIALIYSLPTLKGQLPDNNQGTLKDILTEP